MEISSHEESPKKNMMYLVPEDLQKKIIETNQQHILSCLEKGECCEEKAKEYVEQLKQFDFLYLQRAFNASVEYMENMDSFFSEIKPYNEFTRVSSLSKIEKEEWIRKGLELLSKGEIAIIMLSGGQATRMGLEMVKGEYNIGLPSRKAIFQLLCERIQRVQTLVQYQTGKSIQIPIYIMTSPLNRKNTKHFFQSHHFFGLQEDQISFFSQRVLPCYQMDGKMLMREKGRLATAPNGSGGVYRALHEHGCVEKMRRQGIRLVQIFGLDNMAQLPADPLFVGMTEENPDRLYIKCVEKSCPEEKLGVICYRQGKPLIAEYSELSHEISCSRDNQEGNLLFPLGFTFDMIIPLEFIAKKCTYDQLPQSYHISEKTIPYFEQSIQKTITPIRPNGYKIERYLFDVFPKCENVQVLVIDREDWIPVKNYPGKPVDSPEIAVERMEIEYLRRLKEAGAICIAPKKIYKEMMDDVIVYVRLQTKEEREEEKRKRERERRRRQKEENNNNNNNNNKNNNKENNNEIKQITAGTTNISSPHQTSGEEVLEIPKDLEERQTISPSSTSPTSLTSSSSQHLSHIPSPLSISPSESALSLSSLSSLSPSSISPNSSVSPASSPIPSSSSFTCLPSLSIPSSSTSVSSSSSTSSSPSVSTSSPSVSASSSSSSLSSLSSSQSPERKSSLELQREEEECQMSLHFQNRSNGVEGSQRFHQNGRSLHYKNKVTSYVEISPCISYHGENLERLQGCNIHLPCIICSYKEIPESYLKYRIHLKENVAVVIPLHDLDFYYYIFM